MDSSSSILMWGVLKVLIPMLVPAVLVVVGMYYNQRQLRADASEFKAEANAGIRANRDEIGRLRDRVNNHDRDFEMMQFRLEQIDTRLRDIQELLKAGILPSQTDKRG